MNNRLSIGLISLALSWGSAQAGSFDGSQPLLCASLVTLECMPGGDCFRVPPEAIAAPQFIRLDFKAKTLKNTLAAEKSKTTPIEHLEKVDGKLILQGAEDGVEGVRDGVGWTMSISEETGKMVLTAAADDAAFVIFGACTTN